MKKQTKRKRPAAHAIADLIGSVDGLPADLSARKKHYLRVMCYGRKRLARRSKKIGL
jgi:hypothetical protein